MTDTEIIKALECLCGSALKCRECPYSPRYQFPLCQQQVAKHALALINRQKAEIERLTAMVEAAEDYLHPLPFKNAFDEEILKAKAEAVKEFAEKLKSLVNQSHSILTVIDVALEDFQNKN